MNELLAKLKEERTLCSFYFNEKFDNFSVGIVTYFDAEWCMISRVSPTGYFDGFCCRRTDTIIRISVDNNYIKNISRLMEVNGTQLPDFHVDVKTDFLRAVLAWLKEKNEPCCIELHNYDDLAFFGSVAAVGEDLLTVNCIYGEVRDDGKLYDGKSFVKIEDISAVAFLSEEEEKLKKLIK